VYGVDVDAGISGADGMTMKKARLNNECYLRMDGNVDSTIQEIY